MLCRDKASPPSSSASPPSPAETVLKDDDLLTQILTWLPPRSILKSKSVSKRWLALITSPDFVPRRHSKAISGLCFGLTSPKPSYGFINLSKSPSCRAPFTTLDFAHDPFGIRILNSCNGLLLCSGNNANTQKKSFYVYNPTTNRSITLPDLTPQPPVISGASLAFDPSKSPHYKVICVLDIGPVSYSDGYHYKMVIYSSENRAWKPCGDPFPARGVDFTDGVFWNCSVHWPSLYGDSSLRFDVEQEQLRDLPMPPVLITEPELVPVADEDDDDDDEENNEFVVWARLRYFGQSGNHLNLVEIHESKPLQFDVFEMEPDYSGWFVRYKVDLGPVVKAFPDYSGMFTMMGLSREEDDEDDESYLVLLLPSSHMAVQYRLKDESFRKICDLDAENSTVSFNFNCPSNVVTQFVYSFIESLASV